MPTTRALASLTLLAAFTGITPAADLTAIPRTITREPAYQGKPQYCLLVFGPEAAGRVWLVLDGDSLYVDANGNGDLTEPGEKVALTKVDASRPTLQAKVEALNVGGRRHRNLAVFVTPFRPGMMVKRPAPLIEIGLDVDWPGFKGSRIDGRVFFMASMDREGFLQFEPVAVNAPVIHFQGPLQLTLSEPKSLTIGRESQFELGIGTPGIGTGSFGYLGEGEPIPETAYPTVAITYPPRDGKDPVKVLYELKERC